MTEVHSSIGVTKALSNISIHDDIVRPYDEVIAKIVDYAFDFEVESPRAWDRATATLLDAMGAAIESIATSTECKRLVGSEEVSIPNGFKLPGTRYQLDVMKGAFDMGLMIGYHNQNDAFLGTEWCHPSDNLGAILAAADTFTRTATAKGNKDGALTMRHVLIALIKAYEIQGCFQSRYAFSKVDLDNTILVKVASTAVVSWLLGLSKEQATAAVSHAWVDGHLNIDHHAPNRRLRKGDACMGAVDLCLMAKKGDSEVETPLTAEKWGFYDALFKGKSFDLPRPFGTTVVENVFFRISSVDWHVMTAIDAALDIVKELKERGSKTDNIKQIQIRTHDAAMRTSNKQGQLKNVTDRARCLKFNIAVALLKGTQLATKDFQDDSPWAEDPRVEKLRQVMTVEEDQEMTESNRNQEVRSFANALRVTMKDGTELDEVVVHFPRGHSRRKETSDLARAKTKKNLGLKLSDEGVEKIFEKTGSMEFFLMPVDEFMDLFVPEARPQGSSRA